MSRPSLLLAILCCGAWSLLGNSARAEPRTLVEVSISSVDRILDQLNRISTLLDQPELSKKIQQQTEGVQELSGLDRKRQVRLQLLIDNAQPLRPEVILMLPVTDGEAIMNSIDRIPAVHVTTESTGRWRIQAPRRTFLATSEAGHLLVTSRAELLDLPELQAMKTDAAASPEQQSDLAIRFDAGNLPPLLKDLALAKLDADVENQLVRKPNEDQTEYEVRVSLTELARDLIRQFAQDTERLDARFRFEETLHLDISWTARADSTLAREFSLLPLPSAQRAELPGPDHAFRADLSLRIPERIRDALTDSLKSIRNKVGSEVGPHLAAEDRLPAHGVFDTIFATLGDGRWIGSIEFQPTPEGRMLFFSSTEILQSERLAKSLQTVLPYVADSDQIRSLDLGVIHTDSETIHRLQLQTKAIRYRDRKLYGPEAAVWFGTSPHAFLVAVSGTDVTESLQNATSPVVTSPPLAELHWRLRPWLELANPVSADSRVGQQLQNVLDKTDGDNLRIVLTAGPQQLEAGIQLESGFLRCLGQFLPEKK